MCFDIFIKNNIMRNKLKIEEKKIRVTVTLNRELDKLIGEIKPNKSAYIEKLIYNDLINNKIIDKIY
jgi:hypothetical protein